MAPRREPKRSTCSSTPRFFAMPKSVSLQSHQQDLFELAKLYFAGEFQGDRGKLAAVGGTPSRSHPFRYSAASARAVSPDEDRPLRRLSLPYKATRMRRIQRLAGS
jgi:hypothetical protein